MREVFVGLQALLEAEAEAFSVRPCILRQFTEPTEAQALAEALAVFVMDEPSEWDELDLSFMSRIDADSL